MHALLGAKRPRAAPARGALTQVELAERLGVSASYLNLIENNRRPLTAPLLIRLAQIFQLDLQTFASDRGRRALAPISTRCSAIPSSRATGLTNADLRELVATSPNVARAVLTLYRTYATTRESLDTLGERLGRGRVRRASTTRGYRPRRSAISSSAG